MHIYSVTIKATNRDNKIMLSTMPSAVKAECEESGGGKAMGGALRSFSKFPGWVNHVVEILQIPDEWVNEVFKSNNQ